MFLSVREWSSFDCGGCEIEVIEASTLAQAINVAIVKMPDDTTALDVLEVTHRETIDHAAVLKMRAGERRRAKEREAEDRERAEWERLRKRFGDR